jgi:DNA polymerase-3 subunit alpha
LNALDTVVERAARKFRDAERGQFGLFGEAEEGEEIALPECEPWTSREQLIREKEALGFFLTGHPLDHYRNVISMMTNTTSREVRDKPNGERAVVGGMVTAARVIQDRNNRQMAFVTLEDREGQTEVLVFADAYEKWRGALTEDNIVLVEGRVSRRNGGEGKVMVDAVTLVSEDQFPSPREVHFTLELEKVGEEKIGEIKQLLSGHEGETRIFFHMKEAGQPTCVIRARNQGVKLDYELVRDLSASIGTSNIRLVPQSVATSGPERGNRVSA